MIERRERAGLYRFKNQYVRDLGWVLTSAPLIDLSCQAATSYNERWLIALDQNPEVLEQHLLDKNLKMLGPYFEALWEFYLSHGENRRLIAKNIQVFSKNATLGEFDFIYFDKEKQQYRHLEVAVKYYLGLPPSTENNQHSGQHKSMHFSSPMSYWLGPGTRDRLDKKYHKLIEHQSRLSQTIEGQKVLNSMGISQIESEVSLLGYLFYPLDRQIAPPDKANSLHNKGLWAPLRSIDKVVDSELYYSILEKPHWLAAVSHGADEVFAANVLKQQLEEHFKTNNRPVLVAEFEQFENLGRPLEYLTTRLIFIVPNDWPV